MKDACANADVTLQTALHALEDAKADQCRWRGGEDACAMRRRQIDRLALVCPSHEPTLLASAALAYDAHEVATAQQYLDRLLSMRGLHADAAVLRAQIAIDEGNLPFARRFLDEQIKLSPDHAGLRELHGAALYLSRDLDAARLELLTARAMGAPGWRIAYHMGLIEEAAGHPDIAATYYKEAVAGNPGWEPARARLRASELRSAR